MRRLNKAFTLTELLIALGVIGAICVILLPTIMHIIPQKNTMMGKRAFYAIKAATAEIVNDESCYPDDKTALTDAGAYMGCTSGGGNATLKFKDLFMGKLGANEMAGVKFKATDNYEVFTTKDGVVFGIYEETPGKDSLTDDKELYITVDIDGIGVGNDCGDGGESTVTAACVGQNPDQFAVKVHWDGTVTLVGDSWIKKAVKVNRNIADEYNK